MEATALKLLQEAQEQLKKIEEEKQDLARQKTLQRKQLENELALKHLEAKLDSERQQLEEVRRKLEEEREAFETEKQTVKAQQLRSARKIKLDVGGRIYATSLTTLTSQPNSMLAAMFSGRHPLEKDEDGTFFIDRNGKLFGFILEWLRTNDPPVVSTEEEMERLLNEAEYYRLGDFSVILKGNTDSTGNTPILTTEEFNMILNTAPLGEFKNVPCKRVFLVGYDLRNINLRFMNFRMCDLRSCNLSGMDLGWIHFENSIIVGCNFGSSDLTNANFAAATIGCSDFSNAKLPEATLASSHWIDCNLSDADLSKANLEGAKITGSDFHNARLSKATHNGNTFLQKCDFTNAELPDTNLRSYSDSCNFTGAKGLQQQRM